MKLNKKRSSGSCRARKHVCLWLLVVMSAMAQGCGNGYEIEVSGFRSAAQDEEDKEEPDRQSVPEDSVISGEGVIPDEKTPDQTEAKIAVYVCGAVWNPGVCYLPSGARVCDALEAAGGFGAGADSEWLNQARLLADGEMVVVYTLEETARMKAQGLERGGMAPDAGGDAAGGTGSGQSGGAGETGALINLNTASKEQLMTLPGIGEAKADAIIRYRTETGFFATTEDVMNISGIKNSVYDKIRDRITV